MANLHDFATFSSSIFTVFSSLPGCEQPIIISVIFILFPGAIIQHAEAFLHCSWISPFCHMSVQLKITEKTKLFESNQYIDELTHTEKLVIQAISDQLVCTHCLYFLSLAPSATVINDLS